MLELGSGMSTNVRAAGNEFENLAGVCVHLQRHSHQHHHQHTIGTP